MFTVGLLPAAQEAEPPTPPGVLPALTDHGAQETTGLLQGEEGGQVQVGQQEGDDGRGQGGEEGAPPALALTAAHHAQLLLATELSPPTSNTATIQRHCVVFSPFSSPAECRTAFYFHKIEYLESRKLGQGVLRRENSQLLPVLVFDYIRDLTG